MDLTTSPRASIASPLTGMRVLDLSPLLPGPYCSRLLADFGAEVIKVERPGGGDWTRHAPPFRDGRSVFFHILNRGKKSLTLNLKSDEGQAIFLRLVKSADVLLESFRPGVMDRLGLDPQTLAQANPRLVHCSLSGYGPHGPYRDRAGHDLNFIGLAGVLDLTGLPGEKPVIPGVPLADITGGLWAAIGILLALLARRQGGTASRVETSLLGAALACLPVAVAGQLGGQPVGRGASELTGGIVCYQVYACKDEGSMTLAALEPEFWVAFCQAVDKPHLLKSQFAPAVQGDPVYEELSLLFRGRTRQEWVETFASVDCCCEPVYSLAEALVSPQIGALGMMGSEGSLPPVRLAGDPVLPPGEKFTMEGKAPDLGEHTAVILAELGLDPLEIERLRSNKIV